MRKKPPDREALAAAWATRTIPEICAVLGISNRSLYHWAKKYGLGPKPWGTHGARTGCRRPDATEEEIREYTLSLQATWSEAERERRAGKSRLAVAVKAMGYDGRFVRFTEKPL